MDEIKVVPYIPDEDYDNPAMVVDFYEFTMANCLFLHGFKDTTLVFDMFFRKNPDAQGYSISAGQRKLTRFLLNYHFNAQDIWWLRTKGMSEEFCEYLRTYQWKGDMYALPEGTVAYPHVQMVRPHAPQRDGIRHPPCAGRKRRQRWCICCCSGRLRGHCQLLGRDEVRRGGQGCGHRSAQLHRVLPHGV